MLGTKLRDSFFIQADVSENVRKQAQLMEVIAQSQSAYKQAFGYNEWRAACEVSPAFLCPAKKPLSWDTSAFGCLRRDLECVLLH